MRVRDANKCSAKCKAKTDLKFGFNAMWDNF